MKYLTAGVPQPSKLQADHGKSWKGTVGYHVSMLWGFFEVQTLQYCYSSMVQHHMAVQTLLTLGLCLLFFHIN